MKDSCGYLFTTEKVPFSMKDSMKDGNDSSCVSHAPSRYKMAGVKLTDQEREVLRKLGKRSRRETEKRIGKRKLIEIAQAQGHHGKKGGRPKTYPACETNDVRNPRHRFYNGKCSLCGIAQRQDKG